jgi:hypothetical protein
MLLDPSQASASTSGLLPYSITQAGPFEVVRLEERRVLAAAPWTADTLDDKHSVTMDDGAGSIGTLSVPPTITAPGPQATVEGSPLTFSAATGRLIRIDDPDIGANPLIVQITAFETQGRVTPQLYFGSTAGLTVSGNGVNVYQFQGSLAAINNALALVTFVGPDNGDYSLNISVVDNSTGESDSASVLINVTNAAPQLQVDFPGVTLEGTVVHVTTSTFDPGQLDSVQVVWTVSTQGSIVAQGVGPVSFLAPNDGTYDLTVTAVDQDGGAATVQGNFVVTNSDPLVGLTAVVRDGITYVTISISDPGYELFSVDVRWTQNSVPLSFQTTQHVVSLEHKYTPEELSSLEGPLTIEASVGDDHGFARATFNFVEAKPDENPRPSIEPLAQEPPPERDPAASIPFGSSPEQIVSADLSGHASSGKQDATAIHQFVLRLVSADGEESGNYLLPPEALADLPNYLKKVGIPDGHYRVYLVMGDLERLVIDGHFRAGRIVDPSEQSAAALGFSDSAAGFPDITATEYVDIALTNIHGLELSTSAIATVDTNRPENGDNAAAIGALQAESDSDGVEQPLAAEIPGQDVVATLADVSLAETRIVATIATGVMIVSATSLIVGCAMRTSTEPVASQARTFNRLRKTARFARKILRSGATPHEGRKLEPHSSTGLTRRNPLNTPPHVECLG